LQLLSWLSGLVVSLCPVVSDPVVSLCPVVSSVPCLLVWSSGLTVCPISLRVSVLEILVALFFLATFPYFTAGIVMAVMRLLQPTVSCFMWR